MARLHQRHQSSELKQIAVFLLFLFVTSSANADTEIYKCVDADGNVAFQQTPCPVVKEEEPEVVEPPEQLEELEEQEELPAAAANNQTPEEVEVCKDPLRDAIDEIEAEMLRGFSPEQGAEFKVKLRTLTQDMRACG